MPDRVFVHIGLPKTGTTYLQNLMYAHAEAFRAQGTTVIGRHLIHHEAASELAGMVPARRADLPSGRWDEVVAMVRAADTPAVVFSNERYSLVRRDGVDRMVGALPDAEVHMVLTVRDLVAAEPSAWQEYVKNGGSLSWHEHCAGAVADPQGWRRRRRVRRVLRIWSRVLPPERIHVLTVPPPGGPRTVIWDRYCSVLGIDPARLDAREPDRHNTSLDFLATELIRRLNAHDPPPSVGAQRGVVKRWLANGVLENRPASRRPRLPEDMRELVAEESRWLARTITRSGYHVVGSPDELLPPDEPAPAPSGSEDPTDAELLDVALEALVLMTERSYDLGQRLKSRRQQGAR